MEFLPDHRRDHIEKVSIIGPSDGGGYSFTAQNGDVYHGKPTIVGGHQPGESVLVGYMSGRREPVILEGWQSNVIRLPKIHLPQTGQNLYGLWPIPEGQPRLSRSSSLLGYPMENTSKSTVSGLDRVASGGQSYAELRNKLDGLGLLGLQGVNGDVSLLAYYRRYTVESSPYGEGLRIKRVAPSGMVLDDVTLPIYTRSDASSEAHSRHFGHFFYYQSEQDTICTINYQGSLITFTISATPQITISQLATIAQTPGTICDGGLNIAGGFAVDCRYSGMDNQSAIPRTESDRSIVRFYRLDGQTWTALPAVDCRGFIPSSSALQRIYPVGLVSSNGIVYRDTPEHVYVHRWVSDGVETSFVVPAGSTLGLSVESVTAYEPSGIPSNPAYSVSGSTIALATPEPAGRLIEIAYSLDTYDEMSDETLIEQEFAWQTQMPSARWPLYAVGNKSEWWWHIASEHDNGRHLQIVATNAATGATELVWRQSPELWDGSEVVPGIVSSQYSTMLSDAALSRQPGAPETLLFNGQRAVSPACYPADESSFPARIEYWRGHFVTPLATPTTKSRPLCTQPQADRLSYDDFDWESLPDKEKYGDAGALSWSRHVPAGHIGQTGNHYLIYNVEVPYATGAGGTLNGFRTSLDTAEPHYVAAVDNGFGGIRSVVWPYSSGPLVVNPPETLICVDSNPYYGIEWYANQLEATVSFVFFWRTYVVSHQANTRSLRYKRDISLRYNLPNGWQQIPCHAGVWAYNELSDLLIVLRDDFWNRSGDTLIGFEVEPCLDLYQSSNAAHVARINLHPSSDGVRRYVAHDKFAPTMRLNQPLGGNAQVIVCCRWRDGLDALSDSADGHSYHVIDLVTRSITHDRFETGLLPSQFPSSKDLNNSVIHLGKIYWIHGSLEIASI